MNPLIRPVYHLMNRLRYRGKFMLIASFLAVPLLLLSTKLAFNFHAEAIEAENTREKLQDISQATRLIEQLERYRDVSVVEFLTNDDALSKQTQAALTALNTQIDKMLQSERLGKHELFLHKLQGDLVGNRIFPGNEGASVSTVFQNANSLVELAYIWRMKLSYEYVAYSNQDVRAILELLNDSYFKLVALGQTRSIGTYYLVRGYVDSVGISVLDTTFQDLSRLVDGLSLGTEQYLDLFERFPALKEIISPEPLLAARDLLDLELIQAIDIEFDPAQFFELISIQMEQITITNEALLQEAATLLELREQEVSQRLFEFYAYAVLLTLFLIYLLTGFYTYIQRAINSLVKSAQSVAKGEFGSPIDLNARDELQELAVAMEEMRLKLKAREDQLRLIGQTDGLTQLKNRAFFDEMFPITLSSCSRNRIPISVILMDVDHFKKVNDQFGHQVGDDCLRQITDLFKKQFKRKTDVVARYGGEEFIAYVVGLSAEQVYEQVENLRRTIESHAIESGDVMLNVTASFGLAHCTPNERTSSDKLAGFCDSLLYQAKNSGRNRVVSSYYPLQAVS